MAGVIAIEAHDDCRRRLTDAARDRAWRVQALPTFMGEKGVWCCVSDVDVEAASSLCSVR